jgi:hypothetical protein
LRQRIAKQNLKSWLWSTNHAEIWVCTNLASLRSIAFQHTSIHVATNDSPTLCFPGRER